MASDKSHPQSSWIALSEPDLGGREREYLVKCIDDGWVSSAGPYVTRLEETFATYSERKFGVSTCSGTAALQLTLVALGLGAGSHVLIPDWTFAATANAVIHANALPVFVDICSSTLTVDPALVERRLNQGGIDAVIAVDVLGHICDMDRLSEICARAGVPLISDAAGSIGATYKGLPAGNSGAAAIFSLNGNKVVTGGGGGMIVTDDDRLAARARHLSTQARPGMEYIHDAAGYNYRLTNLNAAVALAQMERLDEMIARRLEIAKAYDRALAGHARLQTLPTAKWSIRNGWLYSVLVDTATNAADLVSHLGKSKIQARPFWRSLSAQAPYLGYECASQEVSRSISGRVVSLPSSSTLDDTGVGRVLDAISSWSPVKPGPVKC